LYGGHAAGRSRLRAGATCAHGGASMKAPRARKPRPPLVVRPSFVSQDTSLALLGLSGRKFLDVLVSRCRGGVVRVGRTVLVPLEVAESELRTLASDAADSGSQGGDDEGQPTSVDEVLASVGVRRRGAL